MASLVPSSTSQDVLALWFGPNFSAQQANTLEYLRAGWRRWFFGKDVLFDAAQRSASELIRLISCSPPSEGSWNTPHGSLAQIILLDQFARCAFRGEAEAFSYDSRAVELSLQLVNTGAYTSFLPVEKFWIVLALSHSENLEENRLHVNLASTLGEGAPAEVGEFFASLQGFPHEHFETIERFGRFPHRNAVLGRHSTAEEVAWLTSPTCPGWARSQKKAKLTYWDGRGLGDPVRFLLEFTLMPFDEENITSREQFLAFQESGLGAFSKVPVLEIDGQRLVETLAILRYIAGKKDLRGGDLAKEALVDAVASAVMEVRLSLIQHRWKDDREAALESWKSLTLPKLAAQLETLLGKHEGPYLCGEVLSYADIALLELCEYATDECGPLSSFVEAPRLLAHHARMRSFSHVQKFLGSPRRKRTPDDAWVRQTCGILAMPLPAYLSPSSQKGQLEAPTRWGFATAAVAVAAAAALLLLRKGDLQERFRKAS